MSFYVKYHLLLTQEFDISIQIIASSYNPSRRFSSYCLCQCFENVWFYVNLWDQKSKNNQISYPLIATNKWEEITKGILAIKLCIFIEEIYISLSIFLSNIFQLQTKQLPILNRGFPTPIYNSRFKNLRILLTILKSQSKNQLAQDLFA